MALERRNLLPVGRYYKVVVGAENIRTFDEWLARYREQANLRVLRAEYRDGGLTWSGPEPPSEYVAFEVLRDGVVSWEGPGLPDIIPAGGPIPSRSDTLDRPPPPGGFFDSPEAASMGQLLVFGGLLYLLFSQKERNR